MKNKLKFTFAERQLYIQVAKLIFILGLLIVVMVATFRSSYTSIVIEKKWLDVNFWLIIISMTIGMVFMYFLLKFKQYLDNYFDRAFEKIEISRKGIDGEKKVFSELRRLLGPEYTIHQNYNVPGYKFDIDFIIVGPGGLIVLEVKNYSQVIKFTPTDTWLLMQYGKIRQLLGKDDPRLQLNYQSDVLKRYLHFAGIKGFAMRKALVFINNTALIDGSSGIYIVKGIAELPKYVENIYRDETFTPDFCNKINLVLSE